MKAGIHRLIEGKTADRPLTDLKRLSTTIATDINDLPTTSPHGGYSEHDSRNLGFATDANRTRGTAARSVTEVGAILRCHGKTLYQWVKKGSLTAIRIDAKLKFDVARHHPRLQSPNNAYMGARLGKTASTTGFLFSEKRAITYLTGLLEKGTFWT